MRKLISLQIILLIAFGSFAQPATNVLSDTVYHKSVKSVVLYQAGKINSLPVLNLQDQTMGLTLAFDDLDGGYTSLYYRIRHCNYNWQDDHIFESDYLQGNSYEDIEEYQFSFNTYINYTNYYLRFPTVDMRIMIPGNYVIEVYSADNEDDVWLRKRFYVLDNAVSIDVTLKRPSYAKYIKTHQQIDFQIDYSGLDIFNAVDDIKVAIRQNQRWDNMKTGLKANYVQNNTLIYQDDEIDLFEGLSEWRFSDMRNLQIAGRGVGRIILDSFFHVILLPEEDRSLLTYAQWADANGERIFASDNHSLQVNELDYVDAFFHLSTPYPAEDEVVYIFGALSNWKISDEFRMKYDPATKTFYKHVLLKQGYYNYYYVRQKPGNKVDCSRFQGSHYETENNYYIFVYYYSRLYQTDLLVGYTSLNSFKDR